jgi:large subunit ribosomal protein L17
MNSKTGFNRLGRRAAQRRALIKNLVTSLFRYERIITTKAKALEVRRTAEKMVTRARVDSVHNRRIIARVITKDDVLKKLFTEIAPRFKDRPGGYTRVLKLGLRDGDASQMALLEFVDRKLKEESTEKSAAKKEKKAQVSKK